MADEQKQGHHRTITLSTIVSILAICGVILPVGGLVSSPFIVQTMSRAMAGEIHEQVKAQTAPTKEGVKAILQDKIDDLAMEVEVLESQRAREPSKFTREDATRLASFRARLQRQREALQELQQQEGGSR